jgi:hypothetical protein
MVGFKGIHVLVNLSEELAEWGIMSINSEMADAVAKRISPSNSAQELSYFPSAISEQMHKEKGCHPIGPLGVEILKKIIAEEQISCLILW